MMATFVLVPGAWQGGRIWNDVTRDLRRRGHDVYPVSLTGLGERAHLARPEVDLDTHIADVVNLMAYEDLDSVVLVGHSYAGIVVTGVADRVPERLAQLVYLDSAPGVDGQPWIAFTPADGQAALRRQVAENGDGWRLPFPAWDRLGQEASLAGLGEAERALMSAKATPQPFRTYEQPLRLTRSTPGDYRRVAIACDDLRRLIAAGVPEIVAMTAPPWRYEDLATGHWPMLSMPRELAEMLDQIATEGSATAAQ
jgi:pimeloyl-ACP methyl ester carboxylesterase